MLHRYSVRMLTTDIRDNPGTYLKPFQHIEESYSCAFPPFFPSVQDWEKPILLFIQTRIPIESQYKMFIMKSEE